MANEETAIIVTEVAKALISGYLTYAKQKGLSEVEMQNLFHKTRREFLSNDPAKLEDVADA